MVAMSVHLEFLSSLKNRKEEQLSVGLGLFKMMGLRV